jgi:hypothetical protein
MVVRTRRGGRGLGRARASKVGLGLFLGKIQRVLV